jgi:hypothetical protein
LTLCEGDNHAYAPVELARMAGFRLYEGDEIQTDRFPDVRRAAGGRP